MPLQTRVHQPPAVTWEGISWANETYGGIERRDREQRYVPGPQVDLGRLLFLGFTIQGDPDNRHVDHGFLNRRYNHHTAFRNVAAMALQDCVTEQLQTLELGGIMFFDEQLPASMPRVFEDMGMGSGATAIFCNPADKTQERLVEATRALANDADFTLAALREMANEDGTQKGNAAGRDTLIGQLWIPSADPTWLRENNIAIPQPPVEPSPWARPL